MKHRTLPSFWRAYDRLPGALQKKADESYALWKNDPTHPSLEFKQVGDLRGARIDSGYRALAYVAGDSIIWFWIGPHDEYLRLIRTR